MVWNLQIQGKVHKYLCCEQNKISKYFLSGCIFSRFKGRLKKAETIPCPVNVTFAKGSMHVAVTRKLVDWVINDKVSLAFRDWVKDTSIPDETFFSSLNVSPQIGVPAAYAGKPQTDQIEMYM